jgi:hypothetical protein
MLSTSCTCKTLGKMLMVGGEGDRHRRKIVSLMKDEMAYAGRVLFSLY